MNPCWDRTYDATPQIGNAQLNPNNEAPLNATFRADITVNFSVPYTNLGVDPMRIRSSVNLPYVIQYYIDKPGITGEPLSNAPLTSPNPILITGNSFNKVTNGSGTVSAQVNATIPAVLQAGDRVCFRLTTTRSTGTVNTSGNITSGSGVRVAPDPAQQEAMKFACTGPAQDQPYFRVYGGDVLAGSNFLNGSACTPTAGSGILAWNRDNTSGPAPYAGTPYGGSGVQLAAFALSAIDGFASSVTHSTGGTPRPPRGLSFANQLAGNWGGSWDASNVACGPDYFASAPTSAPTPANNITSMASGAYYVNGNFTINNGGNNLQGGKKIEIYVDGNVAITDNIRWSGNPNNPQFKGVGDIPSFRIIARNIYIAPNVTEISGVLIAQPTGGTGGEIYTCSDGAYGVPGSIQLNGPCRQNTLTVYGALIAQRIKFLRTRGSLRNSQGNEPWNYGGSANNPGPAERIIYTPEVWLANPVTQPPFVEPYEASTALPPIL